MKQLCCLATIVFLSAQVGYAHTKNSSSLGTDDTSTEKGWLYGLGAGRRTAQYDLELTYNHGSQLCKRVEVYLCQLI